MFSSSAHCRIHSYSWGKTSHQWNSQRKGRAQFLFRPVDPRANVIGIIRKIARPKDWSSKSFPIMTVIIYTGWWYTYASEKYEFVSWHDCSQYMKKCNSCSKRPTSTPFLLPEIWNSHEGGEDGMPGMPCKCSLHLFLGAAVWLHTIWYADSFLLKLAYLVRSIYLPNMMVFHGYVRNCQVWFTTQTTPGFSIEMSCHIWPTKGFYMALGNFHAQASHRPRLPHWHSPPPATPRRNVASAAPEPSATRRTSRRRWWRRSTSFPHRGWGKAIVNF